jgi:endonuclease YncB( thermonuclease family)
MARSITEVSAIRTDYKGILEVYGTIPFEQFYYQGGESDADTVKMKVKSMRFSADGNSGWRNVIDTFKDAKIRGKQVVKNNTITIRLQGIDAPELHYESEPRTKQDENPEIKQRWIYDWFRQYRGAKAVCELERFLKPYSESGIISAMVYTRVDHPNDVFDMYGRFVGDIVLQKDNKNVNHWLAEEGWAFPTYYNSMTKQEILDIDSRSKTAMGSSKGVWNGYSNKVVPFDFTLKTPKGKKAKRIDVGLDDTGNMNLPKIFRRQVDYEIRKNAGEKIGSFVDYLISRKDKCYRTSEFLKGKNTQTLYLDQFVREDGIIDFKPSQIVFVENNTQVLRDSNDNKIKDWT